MAANDAANANVVVDPKDDWVTQEANILKGYALIVRHLTPLPAANYCF